MAKFNIWTIVKEIESKMYDESMYYMKVLTVFVQLKCSNSIWKHQKSWGNSKSFRILYLFMVFKTARNN